MHVTRNTADENINIPPPPTAVFDVNEQDVKVTVDELMNNPPPPFAVFDVKELDVNVTVDE